MIKINTHKYCSDDIPRLGQFLRLFDAIPEILPPYWSIVENRCYERNESLLSQIDRLWTRLHVLFLTSERYSYYLVNFYPLSFLYNRLYFLKLRFIYLFIFGTIKGKNFLSFVYSREWQLLRVLGIVSSKWSECVGRISSMHLRIFGSGKFPGTGYIIIQREQLFPFFFFSRSNNSIQRDFRSNITSDATKKMRDGF